jgi:diguanylate cyclase (GGDEF)-like protein/putative nucleotidyltransferase with HDIG domain
MRLTRSTADRLPRSPRLLLLVFGIFLMLIGITGSALVAVTSSHLAGTTLNAIVQRDRSLVDLFANSTLTVADLDGPMRPGRATELRSQLEALARSDEIVHLEIRDAGGGLVVASGPGEDPSAALLAEALAARPNARIDESGTSPTLQEYLPLATGAGDVLGAFVLYRDAGEVLASLDAARGDVVVITVAAALVLAAILVTVFRAAHVRLRRQAAAIAEAARRDALTGLLNHGAVVSLVAERIDAAPSASLAVALVDIDNFRLFNDTHGHEAGDAVLAGVAELVMHSAGPDGSAARYGPDEFLVVRRDHDAAAMAELAHDLQRAVRSLAVRVGDSEDLPVTVSVGIAAVPLHAGSVTPLLSEATVALTEARASGGDAVLVARIGEERHDWQGRYDVLQGLVLAVDAKDRYTKRHSEDVARYAVYLARRLGHQDILESVRLAGLLHDVGKIGIPDTLLRKPSKLSAAEIAVFNQHVALGDAIVRDLPEVEEVRAGIRHHHERWDGGGYLAGLAGEAIPLIARLIAVADTFSAMTTTRPYRKALSVDEALRRLRDAAGSQLQPALVDAFVEGLLTDPDAPMPNQASDVWLPLRVA